MSESLFSFFISTPHIDAYQHDWEPFAGMPGVQKVAFDGFVQRMESQALEWGEQGVGRAYLLGKTPAMQDGRYVLAFGTHAEKPYVALAREGSSWEVDVVEADHLEADWDVT